MFGPDLRLLQPLEEFIDCFEKLNSRSIPLLSRLFSSDCVFQDPYHRAQGSDQVERLLSERLKHYSACRVYDFSWGRRQGQAYIYSSIGEIEVVSLLSFMPDGLIFSVNEFWASHDVSKVYKRFKL